MFQRDHWPFIPERLGEILDAETLAVIQAGSAERLGTAMSIIDASAGEQPPERIDPINLHKKFAPFCALLRTDAQVQGGNHACEQYDLTVANHALMRERDLPFKSYPCHMGVLDCRHLVYVHGRAVAVLFAGQFRPAEGVKRVLRQVSALGSAQLPQIIPHDEAVRTKLAARAAELQPMPNDFQQRLQREAEYIRRLAEAQVQALKNQWEQEFLDRLRALRQASKIENLEQVRNLTELLLLEVATFCRCGFVVFFANTQENDTVLLPLAAVGLPPGANEKLPHFNWRKAGLADEPGSGIYFLLGERQSTFLKGIRGEGRTLLTAASFAVPTTLGKFYRSVLLFGPFAETIALEQEQRFLSEIGRIIGGSILAEVQVLNLQKQRDQSENRVKLLTHQLRTAITPIATHVGAAKVLQAKLLVNDNNAKLMAKYLQVAQDLCLRLGRAADTTLKSHVLLLERDDLKLERYPLSVLVANCVEGFEKKAQEHQRRLVIDDSIDLLPDVEIDVARFTIAFSNLLENAIKYSYPGTRITVRMGDRQDRLQLDSALIEVQDEGDDIPADQVERIFEPGIRLLTAMKMRKIPGTGLGLWEARAVVEAHGGSISVQSVPTTNYYRQQRAYRVTFAVKIPLQHSK